jgi:hypothetical protein
MEYILDQHRHGLTVANDGIYKKDFDEFLSVITSITNQDLIDEFNQKKNHRNNSNRVLTKSLSDSINRLIDKRLTQKGWSRQSKIFGDKRYKDMRWTLDFAKQTNGVGTFCVEVVFNNAGSLGWNLLKPVLACEQNHVEKAIETKIGIIVLATKEMKVTCGFDNAIATFEDAPLYLSAMSNIISATPIVVVGLCAPKNFKIEHYMAEYEGGKRRKAGRIVMN